MLFDEDLPFSLNLFPLRMLPMEDNNADTALKALLERKILQVETYIPLLGERVELNRERDGIRGTCQSHRFILKPNADCNTNFDSNVTL